MPRDDHPMIEVASRIADGTSVDWQKERGSARDEAQREILRYLEIVQEIVQGHRSLNTEATLVATDPKAAAAAQASTGLRHWGRLELSRVVGAGSFGEVYRAWDGNLGREVALKLLHPDSQRIQRDAVLREGQLLARVRHPNVVVVYGAEEHDGRVGMWMEFVEGRTLEDLVREQGALGAREAALIGMDLCRALTAVHNAGLVHRDVKTRNVMRAAGGRIVLMDFGAGIEAVPAAGESRSLAGTPLYMAPEITRGEPASAGADVYSLGVLLFHLVTGRYPVQGANFDAVRRAHAAGERRLLREARADLPDAFVSAVERALAASPAERFATAGQFEQALAATLGTQASLAEAGVAPVPQRGPAGVAVTMSPPVAAPTASRRFSRRTLGWVAAGIGMIALLAILRAVLPGFDGARTARDAQRDLASSPASGVPAEAFAVRAAFYRRRGSVREPLVEGASVAPGDGLSLEFEVTSPVHLYIVNEDERGEAHLLFPLPGFEPANPLQASHKYVLPGAREGAAFDWEVSSAGGRERLLVIASHERLTDLEAEMLALPQAGSRAQVQSIELSPRARERLRGIGGLQSRPQDAGATSDPSQSRLSELAAKLGAGAESASGIWVRQLEFTNPAPR